jgi:quaternary ammonium compound-resistance protein SugE
MLLLGEPTTAARIFFVSLLLVAVVGLKATSGH